MDRLCRSKISGRHEELNPQAGRDHQREGLQWEKQDHKGHAARFRGDDEPVRKPTIGILTGTIFPSSSLNGGASLVPEKLSNAYL